MNTKYIGKGLVQRLECPPHNPYVPGSKFRQVPNSLTYSKKAASVDERSLPWIWYFWFVNWEKGLVSVLQLVSKQQLHSSRLHCSDVEWGAFAYHVIWESGQMLGIHSRPSDGDVKWRSREQEWGANSHPCLVILWTLIEKRRLEISRFSSTIMTRHNDFPSATVGLPYPWVSKLN